MKPTKAKWHAPKRWRKRLGLPAGLIERARAMMIFALAWPILCLSPPVWSPASNCSIWKRCACARAIGLAQFFKETLEDRIGLETERGSLTFSIVKHVGLAVIGCLTLASAGNGRDGKPWPPPACWRVSSSMEPTSFRRSSTAEHRPRPAAARAAAARCRLVAPAGLGAGIFCSRCSNWATGIPPSHARTNISKP